MSGAINLEALICEATDEIERASIPHAKRRRKDRRSDFWPTHVEQCIEHTLLRREQAISRAEIVKICNETRRFDFLGVCVDREHVRTAKQAFMDTAYIVVAVVGFPWGTESTADKVNQTREAIQAGADEIDMVIAVQHLKARCYQLVFDDIQAVVRKAGAKPVKVILETALLDDYEKVVGCLLAERAGAAFVKTSTGFAASGAKVEDVALMKNVVGGRLGVKAAGGIRDLKTAWAMIEAGADRLGCSSSVHIVNESMKSSSGMELKDRLKYAWDTFSYQANQRQQNFNFFLVIVGALLAGYFKVHETQWCLGELLIALMGVFFSTAFWFLDLRNAELVHCARKELVKLELQAGVPIRREEGPDSRRPQLGVDLGRLTAKFYSWAPGLFRHLTKFKFWFKTIYAVIGMLFVGLIIHVAWSDCSTIPLWFKRL